MLEASQKYLDHLNIYLTSLSHMFSVIAVTETWANFTNESLLIIPGYNSTLKNRLKGRDGGVALFVRQSLTYSVRNDLGVFDNEDLESVFIDLNDINFGRKVIGAIYCPPGNCIDMFMSSFQSICQLYLILNIIVLMQEIGTLIC